MHVTDNGPFAQMDAFRRTCTVSTVSGPHIVHLTMHFPTSYPDKEAPSFELGKATTLDKTVQNKLIKVLTNSLFLKPQIDHAADFRCT